MLELVLKLLVVTVAIQSVRSDTKYRLNTTITPISYAIRITPYFDTNDEKAFTFDGEVNIRFTSAENINQIKLHTDGLNFTASNISVISETNIQYDLDANSPLELDKKYTFAYINLKTDIQVGVEYNLKIIYRGPIRKDLTGFYRTHYVEQGVRKWLGATYLEAVHARKVFPCFDEPNLKAVFILTIDRPEHYQPSLTNTKMQTSEPLSNGYIRETFYPTPRMSTYLVAFLVSEFEAGASSKDGSNEIAIYTRSEAKNQSDLALHYAKRAVKTLSNYFGVDYYSVDNNLSFNHVGFVSKPSGMENWGLISYREEVLLFDPERSTPNDKFHIALTVAHETTHMWFGNLVTCHWWSDTWLNEGFATYFQSYIMSLIEPELGTADTLVTDTLYAAYNADDTPNSSPISNENVTSPEEIKEHFRYISYHKAGSVIRMMHHLLGNDAFEFGLNYYLKANKFQSAYPKTLYDALHCGATTYNSLSEYPETNKAEVMSSWITQAGYPILKVIVNREDFTVTLNQKRFYTNTSNESDEIYKIPITYTIGNAPNFNDTKPAFIMHDRTHVFSISETSQPLSWVMLNIQETGMYRVNYDNETWNLISEELRSSKREKIHHLNRAKIVNDLFALLRADEVSFELLYKVIGFLENETDYTVWTAAVKGFAILKHYYQDTDIANDITKWMLKLMNKVINTLGYASKESDSFVTSRNRKNILVVACELGHKSCIENMLALYKDFKDHGKEVDPSLRSLAYRMGLQYGTGEDYDLLFNRTISTKVANEASLIWNILGASSDENSLRRYLVSLLDDDNPIRIQHYSVPLDSVISNGTNRIIILEEMDKNTTFWESVYNTVDDTLDRVISFLTTEKDYNEFESWLSSCVHCSENSTIAAKQKVADSRAKTTWGDRHREEILNIFRSTY